jgi:hypothetical protein
MYHWIVKQKVRRGFRQLSAGDSEVVCGSSAAMWCSAFPGGTR